MQKYILLSNSSGHGNKFCQIMYFLPKKKRLFRLRGSLNLFTKLTRLGQCWHSWQGGEGGFEKCWQWLTKFRKQWLKNIGSDSWRKNSYMASENSQENIAKKYKKTWNCTQFLVDLEALTINPIKFLMPRFNCKFLVVFVTRHKEA